MSTSKLSQEPYTGEPYWAYPWHTQVVFFNDGKPAAIVHMTFFNEHADSVYIGLEAFKIPSPKQLRHPIVVVRGDDDTG